MLGTITIGIPIHAAKIELRLKVALGNPYAANGDINPVAGEIELNNPLNNWLTAAEAITSPRPKPKIPPSAITYTHKWDLYLLS